MTPLAIDLRGQEIWLHPQRVMIWVPTRTLIAADLHFGKGAWFRRQGIPVPAGSTVQDLARLAALIEAHGIERLLLLGDVFHHRPSMAEPFQQAFKRWRAQHSQLEMLGIIGNHDRHGADALFGDAIDWRRDWFEGPFVFRHEPEEDRRGYVLAGHLHPVMILSDGHDRLRAPVFWFREHWGVLPSFGSLTGGHPVTPSTQDNVFLVGPSHIKPLRSLNRRLTEHS